jgi:hypothetical protein
MPVRNALRVGGHPPPDPPSLECGMTLTSLDTHEVVKELKAAGFTDDQAEAVTRVVRRAQDIDLSSLATKADLEAGLLATKTDLRAELLATKADLQAELLATKADLQAGLLATRADLQAGLLAAKSDLQVGLAETTAEILKWMVGTIGLQTVVILGAVVALARMMGR